MKYIYTILLLLLISEKVLTDKLTKKRLALSMKIKKKIHEAKLKQRKLDDTDTNTLEDQESGYPDNLDTNGTDPSGPSKNMSANDSVATETNVSNPDALLQIRKFHNFTRPPNEKIFTYSAFFYFLGKRIVTVIIVRIKIVYKRIFLRNLQEIEAESVPSSCVIKEKYKEYVGREGDGTNVEYDCSGATQITGDISNATLDTNYSMLLDGEQMSFKEVQFDVDAASEAVNLVQTKSYDLIGTIANASIQYQSSGFFINGIPKTEPELEKKIGKKLNMEFIHYTSSKTHTTKNITCEIYNSSALYCDGTVRTYLSNITAAKCHDEKVYLSINTDPNAKEELIGSSQGITYRKNSSGLTGGAIAGIVIACVVVILAASIAAILLKKPTPPIDNTTIVGLKHLENV